MTEKEALDPMRFVVVGAGGIGGLLAEGLARMLEYRAPGSMLVLVDGDTYEPKNVERQIFTEIGNKAEVKAAQLQPLFPKTSIVPLASFVVPDAKADEVDEEGGTKVGVSSLLQEGDVIFPVVDNFAARALIFNAAKELDDIDVFSGGNSESLDGSTYHYQRRDGHDTTEHPAVRHVELENPPDRNPGELSCAERVEIEGGTQLLATNMCVAAILLARVHACVLEGEADAVAEVYFDLATGSAAGFDRQEEVPSPVKVG